MNQKHKTELRKISDWLRTLGKNREWLANELGVSITTINGWYSLASQRPIPIPTLRLIHLLERDYQLGEPRFTINESKCVIKAMKAAKCDSFEDFARDAVSTKVESILNQPPEADVPLAMVADSPSEYPAMKSSQPHG